MGEQEKSCDLGHRADRNALEVGGRVVHHGKFGSPMSALGHSRPIHSASVPNNVRFAPKATIIHPGTPKASVIGQAQVTFLRRIFVHPLFCASSGLMRLQRARVDAEIERRRQQEGIGAGSMSADTTALGLSAGLRARLTQQPPLPVIPQSPGNGTDCSLRDSDFQGTCGRLGLRLPLPAPAEQT